MIEDVERRRGAKVDDDDRRLPTLQRRDRIRDAVGTDRMGRIVRNLERDLVA